MSIRKRIIWVAALALAFATIELIASRRDAQPLQPEEAPAIGDHQAR